MTLDKFTIKAQEAIQQAVSIAQQSGQQSIEPVHLLRAITSKSQDIAGLIFRKLGINGNQIDILLDKEEQVGWLEVNISCPNVHGGGMSFGTSPAAAAEVTRAVKAVTTKPVIIKLSPNVTDIVSIAKACEAVSYTHLTLPTILRV